MNHWLPYPHAYLGTKIRDEQSGVQFSCKAASQHACGHWPHFYHWVGEKGRRNNTRNQLNALSLIWSRVSSQRTKSPEHLSGQRREECSLLPLMQCSAIAEAA